MTVLNLVRKTYEDEDKKVPLHLELGIIKILAPIEGHKERKVEANFAHPHGMNEYAYGTFKDNEIHLESN